MTCSEVESELVAYHFGLVEPEARARIEAHLAGCGACLAAFFEVKNAIETGEGEPAPSKASRAKLRKDVARELGLEKAARPTRGWSWWERPLAFGVAASVVFVLMGATNALTSRTSAPYALSHPAPERR